VESNSLWLIARLHRYFKPHRFVVPDVDHLWRARYNQLLAQTNIKAVDLARVERRANVLENEFFVVWAIKVDVVYGQQLLGVSH
jgi:hypothetical protein